MNKEQLLSLDVDEFTSALLNFYHHEFSMKISDEEEEHTVVLSGSSYEIQELLEDLPLYKYLGLNSIKEFCEIYTPTISQTEAFTYIKEKSCNYDETCLRSLLNELEISKSSIDEEIFDYLTSYYSNKGWEIPLKEVSEKDRRLMGNDAKIEPFYDYKAMDAKVRPYENMLYHGVVGMIRDKLNASIVKKDIVHYPNSLEIPIGIIIYVWDPRRPGFNKLIATQKEDICKELWNRVFEKHPEIAPLQKFDLIISIPFECDPDDKYESNSLDFFCHIDSRINRVFTIREREKESKSMSENFYMPAFYFRCAHYQQAKLASNDPSYEPETGYTMRLCMEGDYCMTHDLVPDKKAFVEDLSRAICSNLEKHSQIPKVELLKYAYLGDNYVSKALTQMWQGEMLLRKGTRYEYSQLSQGSFTLCNVKRFDKNYMPSREIVLLKIKYDVLDNKSPYHTHDVYEPYSYIFDGSLTSEFIWHPERKKYAPKNLCLNLKILWDALTKNDSYKIGGEILVPHEQHAIEDQSLLRLFSDASKESFGCYESYLGYVRNLFDSGHHLITTFLECQERAAGTDCPPQAYLRRRANRPSALQPFRFFNEQFFSTDERKQELKGALQPVIEKVKTKQDWYAVLQGAQSVKEGKDKFGKKHKVLVDKASDVAMFDDLSMLMPELAESANIFPIDDKEAEATPSSKYKSLRNALSDERKRWTIKGKGELLVTEWEKTEYIPSMTESNTSKRINNKEEKYRRMLKIGKDIMAALEQLRDKYIQS